jgi:hypothetical protein
MHVIILRICPGFRRRILLGRLAMTPTKITRRRYSFSRAGDIPKQGKVVRCRLGRAWLSQAAFSLAQTGHIPEDRSALAVWSDDEAS